MRASLAAAGASNVAMLGCSMEGYGFQHKNARILDDLVYPVPPFLETFITFIYKN